MAIRRNIVASLASEDLFAPAEWAALSQALGLSPRECQILEALTDGIKDAAIAQRLGMSANTVRSHLTRLHRKLGVTSRASLLVHVFKTYQRMAQEKSRRREAPAVEVMNGQRTHVRN